MQQLRELRAMRRYQKNIHEINWITKEEAGGGEKMRRILLTK
jgi:hypothetical protein